MTASDNPQVLIVGGGAIGCAIALALARRGMRDVLVLERDTAGSGSSSRAAGGFRTLFPSEIGVRCALLSRDMFRNAEAELGASIGYREDGYLMLARSPQQAEAFRANAEMQRRLGVDATWLAPAELAAGWPWLRVDDVQAGVWCPDDAVFDQVAFMQALAGAVGRAGVELREHCCVERLLVDAGRVVGVATDTGEIRAGTTVLAAGIWSSSLAAGVGLDLPVAAVRGEVYTTGPVRRIPQHIPFVTDFDRGRYLRGDVVGLRISGEMGPSPELDDTFDPANAAAAIAWAGELIPTLAGVATTGGWAGLVELTPDFHPLLGLDRRLGGLLVATGFSGYGVMHAPAAGQLAAELLLDGRTTTLDISPLVPSRFAEGRPILLPTNPLQVGNAAFLGAGRTTARTGPSLDSTR